jgi:hypothetical protein
MLAWRPCVEANSRERGQLCAVLSQVSFHLRWGCWSLVTDIQTCIWRNNERMGCEAVVGKLGSEKMSLMWFDALSDDGDARLGACCHLPRLQSRRSGTHLAPRYADTAIRGRTWTRLESMSRALPWLKTRLLRRHSIPVANSSVNESSESPPILQIRSPTSFY